MRNLFLFEKLLVIAAVGFITFLMWSSSSAGILIASVFVAGLIALYLYIGLQANSTAAAAVAHVNNSYASAVDGTGIGIAYAKGEGRAVLKVYALGKTGRYAPDELRSVGLKEDRKGNFRSVLLMVRDSDHPEWLIHFNSTKEAKQWKERIMQFAEERGGE